LNDYQSEKRLSRRHATRLRKRACSTPGIFRVDGNVHTDRAKTVSSGFNAHYCRGPE